MRPLASVIMCGIHTIRSNYTKRTRTVGIWKANGKRKTRRQLAVNYGKGNRKQGAKALLGDNERKHPPDRST